MKWLHELITQTKGFYRPGFSLWGQQTLTPLCTDFSHHQLFLLKKFCLDLHVSVNSLATWTRHFGDSDLGLGRQGTIFVNWWGISLQPAGKNISWTRSLEAPQLGMWASWKRGSVWQGLERGTLSPWVFPPPYTRSGHLSAFFLLMHSLDGVNFVSITALLLAQLYNKGLFFVLNHTTGRYAETTWLHFIFSPQWYRLRLGWKEQTKKKKKINVNFSGPLSDPWLPDTN